VTALGADGSLFALGQKDLGQLGLGAASDRQLTPVRVPMPRIEGKHVEMLGISASAYHTLAVSRDGSAWSWGCNHFGQLGDGTTQDRNLPRPVRGMQDAEKLKGVSRIECGGLHNLALLEGGRIAAWGWNYRSHANRYRYRDRDRFHPLPRRRLRPSPAILAPSF
jgi:alpha-tubulin suppressor-like RCC1 family protein